MSNWVKDFLGANSGVTVVKRHKYALHIKRGEAVLGLFTGAPMHYDAGGGNWQPIDTTPVRKTSTTWGAAGVPVTINDDGVVSIDGSSYSQKTNRVGLYTPSTQAFASILNVPLGALNGDEFIASGNSWERHLRLTEHGLREELILTQRPNISANAGDYLVLETQLTGITPPDGDLGAFAAGGMQFPLPVARQSDRRRTPIPCVRRVRKVGSVYYLYTGIPVSALQDAVYPVVIDPDFAASSEESGVVGLNDTYATARSTASALGGGGDGFYLGQYYYTPYTPDYGCQRGFLRYDTSSIGATSAVVSVLQKLTPYYGYGDGYGVPAEDYKIIKASWAASAPLAAGNMDAAFDLALSADEDSGILCNSANLVANTQVTSGYLSAAWVSKTGYTYYAFITSRDRAGTTPTTEPEYNYFYDQRAATAGYRPVLAVVYNTTKTYWLSASKAAGVEHLDSTTSAPGTSTSGTGWTVDKKGANNYALMDSATERASNTFGASAVPDATGPNNTLGDCFRTTSALNGQIASGDWVVSVKVIAVTLGGSQDGAITCRLWKSVNANGSSATQITSAMQTGSTVTNLTTSTAQTSSVTIAIGAAVDFNGEYLFVELGWKITGAGAANTHDVLIQVDASTFVSTPVLTPMWWLSLTGGLTSAGGLTKALTKGAWTGAITMAGALRKAITKGAWTGAITPSGVLTTAKTIVLAATGAITSAGALIRQVNKPFVGSVASGGALIRALSVTWSGAITPAGALVKAVSLRMAGAISSAGSLVTSLMVYLNAAGSIAMSGTLVRQVQLSLSGAVTMAGALVRSISIIWSGAVTSAGTLVKQAQTAYAGTITLAGSLAHGVALAIAGAITPAGSLVKDIATAMAGSLASAGSLVRGVSLSMAGTVASAGSLIRDVATSMAGAIGSAGDLVNLIVGGATTYYLNAVGAITMDGTLTKAVSTAYSGVIGLSGTLAKQPGVAMAGVITMAGALAKMPQLAMAGAIGLVGSLVKIPGIAMVGAIASAGALSLHQIIAGAIKRFRALLGVGI